ncbi:hypothetical protein ACG7TL_008311 [Trametes sanguinea]
MISTEFLEVTKEYYDWEMGHCATTISSLASLEPTRPTGLRQLITHAVVNHMDAVDSDMSNSAELRNRHYDNSRGGWVEASVIPESEVHVEPPSAYAAYESCTPIDQDILHGDDSNYMPFIPLADDPTFDHEDHAMEYKRLAWQEPYRDPDSLEQAKLSLGSHRYRTRPFKRLPVTEPCGVDCTILKQSDDVEDVDWCPEDLDDLRVIVHIGGAITPCDLAHLCRKPCYQVALICQKYDDFSAPIAGPNQQPGQSGVIEGNEDPQDPNASEEVEGVQMRCEFCDGSGGDAFEGSGSPVDGDENALCRNTQIQTGASKLVEVKQGTFGLGLFLLEDARAGDLVTEYTGELIYEPTFLSRSQVSAHVGRSYVFGLNDVFSVDATNAGSPARFINHAPSRRANVAACILSVNGFQRIGVFASAFAGSLPAFFRLGNVRQQLTSFFAVAEKHIAAGSELFMDYGPEYPIGGEDENT